MGFVLYLHGTFPNSFQTTKRHSYDGSSIYMPSFNQFLPLVYPVGVKDLRPFFTRKIDHNSVNLYRIPTKIGTEMCFNKPFVCVKCQLNVSMCSCFMGENAKCAKWRRKNEEIFLKFCSPVSQDWLARFASNLVCRFA